ncbi:MAG: PAS domain-containing protein [Lachnospiraceae bacterium]
MRSVKHEHTSYDGRALWLISICNMQELFEAECAIVEANQKLEDANKQIRAQLDTFANGINGGYMISREDKQFSIAYVSQNVARNQGYTVEEFLDSCMGSALGNVYPPDRSEVLFALTHQLKRKDSYSMKYRVICKDGSVKWVFDSGKRGKDRDGNPVIQSLIMDINDSEQMNMMYRQERRQYRDAITHDCEYSFSVDLTSGYLEDSFEMKNGENPIWLLGLRLPVRFDDYLERAKTVLKSVYTDGRALEDATTANLLQCYQMGIRKCEYDYWDIHQNKYVRATVLMSARRRMVTSVRSLSGEISASRSVRLRIIIRKCRWRTADLSARRRSLNRHTRRRILQIRRSRIFLRG